MAGASLPAPRTDGRHAAVVPGCGVQGVPGCIGGVYRGCTGVYTPSFTAFTAVYCRLLRLLPLLPFLHRFCTVSASFAPFLHRFCTVSASFLVLAPFLHRLCTVYISSPALPHVPVYRMFILLPHALLFYARGVILYLITKQ